MRFVNLLLILPLMAVLGCPASNRPAPVTTGKTTTTTKTTATTDGNTPSGNQPAIGHPVLEGGALAITPENTKIEFVGTKPNGKHDGGFKAFTGGIEMADEAVSKVTLEIDANSLYSDDPKLTGHLKAPDFFDVKTYPKAAFNSTAIKKEAGKDSTHVVKGDLTLHGETKPISFPAKIETTKDTVNINSEFKISRSEFGMTYGKGKVDDPVTIKVSARVPRK